MRLKIITPLSIVVNEDIVSLRAVDASGSFGIFPGHAPFLTALVVSIVRWQRTGQERYCALRGGSLTVHAQGVDITTREAVIGDDLATLDADVLSGFRAQADAERVDRTETVQLQLNAIRHMVSRIKSGGNTGEFR